MDNSPQKYDISKRILETRKQTEELKAQLQNLIDSGINSSLEHNKVSDRSNFDKENINASQNKVQIIKSYDAKHSHHVNKPSSSKVILNTKQRDKKTEQSINKESPKKVRSYDVNEAREYIKRQREKRLEQLKSQNNEKLKVELQKQKLLELHKKSLELVTKNIQAKRERSKSRERTDYIRPDQNIPARNRSASQERNCLDNGQSYFIDYNKCGKSLEQPKNMKLETVDRRKPSLVRLSSDIKARQQKIQSETNHHQEPTQKSVPEPNTSNKNSIRKKNESVLDAIQKNTLKSDSNSDIRQTSLKPLNLFNQPLAKNKSGNEEPQNIEKITEDNIILSGENKVNNILDYKSSKSAGNITVRSPREVNVVSEKIDLGQPVTLVSNRVNDYRKPTCKLSEVAIGTDNLEKDSKETQTNDNQKVEYPLWLQEKPMQAYPFNFINTVKRKLQYAVSSPKPSVEIGVQSSFTKEIFKPETPESFKIIDEVPQPSTKSSKKTNLNSFISHKCLNLDPKTIDHLELFPIQPIRRSQTVSKIFETESESDTSKNIPDISSESGNSLKTNAEYVKQTGSSGLNIERISSMKLKPRSNKSATSTIQSDMALYSSEVQQTEVEKNSKSRRYKSKDTITNGRESKKANSRSIRTDDNQYTSDFHSGSDLSKSRESIISHNSSTYDKVTIHSLDRHPEDHKSTETENNLYSEKHSTYIPENVTSVHSKSLQENISLRNENQEKYSQSVSSVTTGKGDMLEIIPKRTSDIKIDSGSRKFSNGTTTNSNSKENISSSSIVTERKSRASDKNTEESEKGMSKSSTKSSKRSENYTSMITESCPSASESKRISKSESNLQNINTHRGSNNFSESDKLTEVFPLKEPTLSLTVANKETRGKHNDKNKSRLTRNIALRPDRNRAPGEFNDTNEIHLKFEAEIHLLNDFNESLRQFSAVEKAFESLKSKNDNNMTLDKILQNRDTQTSLRTKSSTSTRVTESINPADGSRSQVSTINYSRGSIINVDSSNINLGNSKSEDNNSLISTGLEISNLNRSMSVVGSNPDLSNFENLQSNNFAGMSLRMFEQLIKDEDVRLENLKTILKIREQALLDRTKGELAWLEIQRKHLRETGKLHEASLIKKKQRGILVNHQKEKHEMQRLKQMQKAASFERKIILKEQRNLIKHQLSTDNMLSKMKVNTPRERRLSGPLKVVQSHTESLRSETSVSRRSSSDKDKDILSITSHTHSLVSKVSEVSGDEVRSRDAQSDVDVVDLTSRLASEVAGVPISKMKKSLLMREAALQKRRRAAEELLQWHKKLLEEERRITELELAANAIISRIPNNVSSSTDVEEKYRFKGKQLNQLWFNLTGCEVKKFAEDKIYPMSQIALERFCKSARQYSSKTKKILRKLSDSDINSDYSGTRSEGSVSENIPDQRLSANIRMEVEQSRKQSSSRNEVPTTTVNDYTSDFDVESIEEIVNEDMNVVDQSINRLIDNFSKIKKDISSLSLQQSLKSGEDPEQHMSQRSDKSESDLEISVIETNKTSKGEGEESGSEEVILRLTSEDKINMSNKTASTIEEIKDTLNKSEAVLLKLTEAEEGTKQLSLSDGVATKEETSMSRTDKGVLSLKDTEDKLSTDVSTMNSNDKSSELESEEHDSSTGTKESLLRLGNIEDAISTDVSLNKNSSIKEGRNNLNKTEAILEKLGQLGDKMSTNTSSVEQSPTIEEQVYTDKEDNLTKSKDILQRLTRSEERDDVLSSNKSVEIEENRVSGGEGKDSLNNAKEIILRLSQSEGKISTDVPSDTSSSQKLAVIEENVVTSEGKDNLSKTEEILAKLSQAADRISIEVSNNISKESSVFTENCMDNLIKSEEILLRLQDDDRISSEISSKQLNKEKEESGDGSSNKISEIEESETFSEKNGTEDYVAINEDDRISTDVASKEDSPTSKKTSSKQSENVLVKESYVEGFKPEDEKKIDDRSSENSLESFGETNVDEELSVDEDLKSIKTTSVELQVRESPKEEITEIKAGENTPAENSYVIDGYKIEENKKTELAEEISKEPSITNDDICSEPAKTSEETIESKEESDLKKTDSIVSEKTATKETVTKTSEEDKPHFSEILEQNSSNIDEVSQITSSDVYTEIKETDKSVHEDPSPLSKEDVNSYYEEKEEDSLSSSATSVSQLSVVVEKEDKATSDKSKSSISEEKSSKSEVVDVKKRVSEIMADASAPSRGDKSPRLQDLYITTYDLVSPANSPELGSPTEETKIVAAKSVFGTEAEELLRKQLAIEQEIKQITEQQQKEQPPYLFVREIPNKPPPPYIPPSSLPPVNVITIVPTTDEIEEISKYSARILHKAHLSHNLDNISISENTLGLISKNITKECYKFVFDLCKEISKEHYKQFEKEKCPSWLQVSKKPQLTVVKPLDVGGLEKHLNKNLKELFGYEKPVRRENAIIKWSRKNRDHVDEILVMESQVEEAQWTNYDKDELLVMNEATNEIMNMLLKETSQVFSEILSKRTYLY